MNKIIEIKDLVKRYDSKVVLDSISFAVHKGNFISIIGPNGCGKSTLINIICGLDEPTSGKIEKIRGLKIGFVFQDYKESLLPWRNVYDNLRLPLEFSKELDSEKVDGLIGELKLDPHKNKFPHQLSGGLAQLAAIARALVIEPDILILDEPFKSLDFDVAQHIMQLVLNYCEKNHITTILISHDLDQAVLFADRIIILSKSPTKIKNILEVALPRPRKISLYQEEAFLNERKRIIRVFQDEN